MITRFRATNFRSHASTSIDMRKWTILYGGNGAGKSSILDALNMLSSFVQGAHVGNVFPGGVFSLPAQLHDASTNEIEFEAIHRSGDGVVGPIEEYRYQVRFGVSGGQVCAIHEELAVDDTTVLSADNYRKAELSSTACSDPDAAEEVKTTHRFARRYRLEPRALRNTSGGHHFIEKNGAGLPSSVDHLRHTNPAAFHSLVGDFLALFPDVTDIRTATVGSGDVAFEFDTVGASALSGAHLSDGQALALGILFLAHAPAGPKLLLLDEPEVTLGPTVVSALLDRVDAALSEDRQVVATTHSPYVMKWGIHHDAEVRQVRSDFGSRSWHEALRQQGANVEDFHSHVEPITTVHCCALLETYLVG